MIEIQPDYQGASAYDALAQVELATKLKGGDAKKAVEYLGKGSAARTRQYEYPTPPRRSISGGEARCRRAESSSIIFLQMKPNPEYMPEYRECVERAKKLIQTNF